MNPNWHNLTLIFQLRRTSYSIVERSSMNMISSFNDDNELIDIFRANT